MQTLACNPAQWIQLPSDEEGAFEKYSQGIRGVLRPTDPLQEALAELVISCMWRLRRIPAFEATLVRDEKASFHSTGIWFYRHDWPQAHLALARYEAHLDRCRSKALKELKELQRGSAFQAEVSAGFQPEKQDSQNEPKQDHPQAVPAATEPPPPNTQNPIPNTQTELTIDDVDLDELHQRILETAERYRKENPQNEPKLVPYDVEEITRRAMEIRRNIEAKKAAEQPKEE